MQIVEHIFENADRRHPALIHGNRTLTYEELEESVDHAMGSMRSSPLWPQEVPCPRIGLSCPNGFDHVILSLAILRCGGVLVPIAPELALPEKQHVADTTYLHAIVSTCGQDWQGREGDRSENEVEGMQFCISTDVTTHAIPGFPEAELNALNPALIRFSSGTTGQSKGVILSHATLFARVTACNSGLGIGRNDRVIWMLPMAHHFAVSIILYLLHGATTVIVDSHMGEDVYQELQRTQGTVLYASPFHFAMLAGVESIQPVTSLRLAVSTASALTAPIAAKFHEKFGTPLCQGFGIIEAGMPLLNQSEASPKPESIGRPQPQFEVTFGSMDDQGVGELLLKGPGIFDAYLTPWQTREDVLQDGWFATGDLAAVDEDGDVFLRGRLKSVINVAGLKCFPEEIESILLQHSEVVDARVFSLPHPEMSSVPAAEIVPANPASPPRPIALSKFCKEHLAKYKIPLRYQIVESIERTASGKVKRYPSPQT